MSQSTHSSGAGMGELPPAESTGSPRTQPEGAVMHERTRKSSGQEAHSSVHCEDQNEVIKPSADDNVNLSRNTPAGSDGAIRTGDDAPAQRSDYSDLLDQLYEYTMSSDFDTKSKEAVWLKSSHPSVISLKLQDIQVAVGPEGLLDTDTLNMAIRKIEMEESISGYLKNNSKSMGLWKHCLSSDFARYAISGNYRDADFRRLISGEFPDQRKYYNLDVLCIPVIHESVSHWSLYAFSMNDCKLYILDSLQNHDRHEDVRVDICRALEFTNEQFELFSNYKIEFKHWDYEFAKVPQQKNSYDCGFFIFNFIRRWDGFGLSLSLHFYSVSYHLLPPIQYKEIHHLQSQTNSIHITCCEDTREMRREFLAYILTFKDNEAKNQLPSGVSMLITKLNDLKDSWPETGTMDTRLLQAVSSGDVDEFRRLLKDADAQVLAQNNGGQGTDGANSKHAGIKMDVALDEGASAGRGAGLDLANETQTSAICHKSNSSLSSMNSTVAMSAPQYRLLRGATSDGDGVLHIAARLGHANMVNAFFCELRVLRVEDFQRICSQENRVALQEEKKSKAEVLGTSNQDGKDSLKKEKAADAVVEVSSYMQLGNQNGKAGSQKENLTIPRVTGTYDDAVKEETPTTCIQNLKGVSQEGTESTTKVPATSNQGIKAVPQEGKKTACKRGSKTVLPKQASLDASATCSLDRKGMLLQGKEAETLILRLLRARNCKGETCLHEAAGQGNAKLLELLLLADASLKDETSTPLVQIRDGKGVSPFYIATMAHKEDIVKILLDKEYKYLPSDSGPARKTANASLVVDQLYQYTLSLEDTKSKEGVWLSNSYPSPISLKLRDIQKTVKANGRMDAHSLNFAIRKLGREDTNDGNFMDYKPLRWKHYISTDFARYAIYKEGGDSSLETCIHNEFVDHHNAFDQDANPHSNSQVLCIPVLHDGHWSLYAFNMNDDKLSILDPRRGCKCHKGIRLKICKALEFVKAKFNIFKNKHFSGWRYEVAKECGLNSSDHDSGFLVFNFMRHWDGHRLVNQGWIPTESADMRKYFLAYILSSKDNKAYQLPSQASQLIKKLHAGPAWTRCEMDKALLKALREDNVHEFEKLFDTSETPSEAARGVREKLLGGVTSDGDGVVHIAVRFGKQQLLDAMEKLFVPSDSENCESATKGYRREDIRITIEDKELTAKLFAEVLRARNNRGETCLHEAVRRGNKQFVKSLISMDENLDGKASPPPLVQREDYEGVSPLYLATTLGGSDIVVTLTNEENKYLASYAGPGGKTAMHAAVLLNKDAKELTERLLKWMKTVADVPDLTGMVDKSGNTPLHLLASVGGASIAELLLTPDMSRGGEARQKKSWAEGLESICLIPLCLKQRCGENLPLDSEKDSMILGSLDMKGSCDSATKDSSTDSSKNSTKGSRAALKDSNGWFPIHVAAANGRLDIIHKLLEAHPDCMQSRNDSGQSFLHLAVEKKRPDVVQHVCSEQSLAGILNMSDGDGNTALHLAVKSGNQRMFCSLMGNKRVHLSLANKNGRTPLDLAILGIEPGLRFLLNSRVLIYYHLRLSGSGYGTYRRDVLEDEKVGKLDKEKLSETISKSAGLMAVCAIFMLNISVTAFFSVAKQYFPSTDPNAAAVAAPAPPPLSAAEGKSAVARARTFRALIVFDTITFASSALAAFCSTFAGFSIMDRPTRFVYLRIAGFSLQIACMAVVAVFVLAANLAFSPIDPHIATAAYVLPLAAVTPQLITPSFILLFHVWAIFNRLFQKHVSPRLLHAWTVLHIFLEKHVFPKLEATFRKLPKCFSVTASIITFIPKCFIYTLFGLFSLPVLIFIGALILVGGIIALIVYIIYP